MIQLFYYYIRATLRQKQIRTKKRKPAKNVCGDPPEPFAAETRDGEDAPVDEDPELGLVVPFWQRSGIDRFPVRFVSHRCAGTAKQNRHQETNGGKHFHLDQLTN